jgi:hypothetical protein
MVVHGADHIVKKITNAGLNKGGKPKATLVTGL